MSTYLRYGGWKIPFGFLISYLFTLVLLFMIFLITQLMYWNLLTLAFTLLLCALCIVIIFLTLPRTISTLRFIHNPSKYLLKNQGKSKTSMKLEGLIATLSTKSGIKKPKIEIIEGPPVAFSFGTSDNMASLVVSEDLMKLLDEDELETVILHELFHIKNDDLGTYTTTLVQSKLLHPQLFNIATLFTLLTVLWSFLLGPPLIRPLTLSASLYLSALKLGFYLAVGLVLLVLASAFVVFSKQGGLVSQKYLYVQELLADGFSSILSEKPMKLYSAILKTTGFHDRHASKGKTPELDFSFGKLTYSSTFGTKSYQFWKSINDPLVYDKVGYRLPFVKMMENLIFGSSTLTITGTTIPELRRSLPQPVFNMVKLNKPKFAEFLVYSTKNMNNFNLVECANNLKLQPFQAFMFLWAAARMKKLDLHYHMS
jgi:Zn-dependent protease with chaperone function